MMVVVISPEGRKVKFGSPKRRSMKEQYSFYRRKNQNTKRKLMIPKIWLSQKEVNEGTIFFILQNLQGFQPRTTCYHLTAERSCSASRPHSITVCYLQDLEKEKPSNIYNSISSPTQTVRFLMTGWSEIKFKHLVHKT